MHILVEDDEEMCDEFNEDDDVEKDPEYVPRRGVRMVWRPRRSNIYR